MAGCGTLPSLMIPVHYPGFLILFSLSFFLSFFLSLYALFSAPLYVFIKKTGLNGELRLYGCQRKA
jgi:hypothetical protein